MGLSKSVRCPACQNIVFDGDVGKVRIVKVFGLVLKGKCRSCRAWVKLPFALQTE